MIGICIKVDVVFFSKKKRTLSCLKVPFYDYFLRFMRIFNQQRCIDLQTGAFNACWGSYLKAGFLQALKWVMRQILRLGLLFVLME
jgi:hypothetical protein